MKITLRIMMSFLISIITTSAGAAMEKTAPVEKTERNLLSSYGKLPLSFEENQGQVDPKVAFLSRGKGYILYLTQTEVVLTLKKAPEKGKPEIQKVKVEEAERVLRMQLVGANTKTPITGEEILSGKSISTVQMPG